MFYYCSDLEQPMPDQRFGSLHTDQKLDVLAKYLAAYTTALKNKNFRLLYLDAFAGTGEIYLPVDGSLLQDVEEVIPVMEGSVHRALQVRPAFDNYVFVEKRPQKSKKLYRWKSEYPELADRIDIHCADANEWLKRFCRETNWRSSRAVVFLDPFGNQVEWNTLAAIADTMAIDLWYLFPAGLGVNRQIGSSGQVLPDHAASLDRLFGPHDWRSAFLTQESAADLFGPSTNVAKQADADRITRFMIKCMKTEFKGGVVNRWLPLGRNGAHWYSLLFAWANPSQKAALAGKLASAVMNRK
jgi:three-Cys-motif partner protein